MAVVSDSLASLFVGLGGDLAKLCDCCSAPASLMCRTCQAVVYCDLGCQRSAWRAHKPRCSAPSARALDGAIVNLPHPINDIMWGPGDGPAEIRYSPTCGDVPPEVLHGPAFLRVAFTKPFRFSPDGVGRIWTGPLAPDTTIFELFTAAKAATDAALLSDGCWNIDGTQLMGPDGKSLFDAAAWSIKWGWGGDASEITFWDVHWLQRVYPEDYCLSRKGVGGRDVSVGSWGS